MDKVRLFFKSKANQFVIKIVLAYALWKALYYFFNHGPEPVATAWVNFTVWFGGVCAVISGHILNAIGEHNTVTGIHINLTQGDGRWWDMIVAEHCLAIPAMVIFIATIAAFPGRLQRKLWFIPLGLFLILVINIMRLVFLCIVFVHCPHSVFHFFHTYVYVVITYALIFLMMAYWMKYYADEEPAVSN